MALKTSRFILAMAWLTVVHFGCDLFDQDDISEFKFDEQGEAPNSASALCQAVNAGDFEAAKNAIESVDSVNEYCGANLYSGPKLVELLIEKFPDERNLVLVKLMLKKGLSTYGSKYNLPVGPAGKKASVSIIGWVAAGAYTPDQIELVKLLLKKGAEVNDTVDGQPLVFYAVSKKNEALAFTLLDARDIRLSFSPSGMEYLFFVAVESGASSTLLDRILQTVDNFDLEHGRKNGLSTLHYAVEHGDIGLVKKVIAEFKRRGKKLNGITGYGFEKNSRRNLTPAELAKMNNRDDIAALFEVDAPGPKPQPRYKPEANPGPQPQYKPQSKPQPQPQYKPQANPQPQPQPQYKPQANPQRPPDLEEQKKKLKKQVDEAQQAFEDYKADFKKFYDLNAKKFNDIDHKVKFYPLYKALKELATTVKNFPVGGSWKSEQEVILGKRREYLAVTFMLYAAEDIVVIMSKLKELESSSQVAIMNGVDLAYNNAKSVNGTVLEIVEMWADLVDDVKEPRYLNFNDVKLRIKGQQRDITEALNILEAKITMNKLKTQFAARRLPLEKIAERLGVR